MTPDATALVTLEAVPVLYVAAEGGLTGAGEAFRRLEGRFASLRGRKFYGLTFLRPEGWAYWAAVAREPGDDPAALGLPTWEIPGGRYARRKLADWEQHTDEIGPAFEAMAAEHPGDRTRPSIEFYRSQRELILLLPVQAPAG